MNLSPKDRRNNEWQDFIQKNPNMFKYTTAEQEIEKLPK